MQNMASQNFDLASLNCCKNNTFKHFDVKIWTGNDVKRNDVKLSLQTEPFLK